MKNNIIISISVIITIGIVVAFGILENEKQTSNEIIKNDKIQKMTENNEVQGMIEKVKNDKIKNDNSENPYIPKEREWIQSGPFKIDRSEYVLGEKIFINLDSMEQEIKGKIIFKKIINDTHSYNYKSINFDGSKPQQNFYLGIYLSQIRGICTVDMLVGDWELVFEGTNIENLKFKILDQILPGNEEKYESVC